MATAQGTAGIIATATTIAMEAEATDGDMGTAIAVGATGMIATGAGSGVIEITTEDFAVAMVFATTTMTVISGVEATEEIMTAMGITGGVAVTETADTTGAAVASTGVAVAIMETADTTGVAAGIMETADTTGAVEGITAMVGTMEAVDIMAAEDITVIDGLGRSVNLLRDQASKFRIHEEEDEMTKDPVCKMDIDEKQTNFHSDYAGRKYHFCSEECKDTFDSQPERYAASAA